MTDIQKFDLWPDLWRHQWRSDKLLQHIRKVQARAIKDRFRIENWMISLTDSRGRGGGRNSPRPHRRVGSENTPSGRGLTRDRPPGGEAEGADPAAIGFSWITSVAFHVSKRNLACFFLHQCYVFIQSFGTFPRKRVELYWCKWPNVKSFWSKIDKCLKNHQK